MARDTVESCAVILFIIVLGTIVDDAIETTPSYTSTVFSNIVILIVSKALCNVIVIVK